MRHELANDFGKLRQEIERLVQERDEAQRTLAAALGATGSDRHEVIHAAVAVMDHPQGPRILRHAVACERRVAVAEAERDALAAQIAGLREALQALLLDVCGCCGAAMCSACFEMGCGVCKGPHRGDRRSTPEEG